MAALRWADVLYFAAEMVVYVAVAWWGFTRAVPDPARWCLGLGAIALLAVAWGLLASPKAGIPLHGAVDVLFRVLWFGLGAAAAVAVLVGGRAVTVR